MSVDALRQLNSNDPTEAWRTLADITDAVEFAAALDYAIGRGLLSADFAGCFRGEAGAVASKYWINPIDGSQMVWIPEGDYLAGDPPRKLRCRGFFLARYPITNAQYAKFVSATNYIPPANHPLADRYLRHWQNGQPKASDAQLPVNWVSCVDAWHYCRWARLTLPNEWHWEKGARGADGRTYPWGDMRPDGNEYWGVKPLAQVRDTGLRPVGSFAHARTPYGCEDMIGNVSEWCQFDELDGRNLVGQSSVELNPATLDYLETYGAVRGSAFLRRVWSGMGAAHRRRLAVCRRNQWVGFRPAFYPPACRTAK
jgi:formylglycine-generating enzyme required for sulfatase activity